MLSKLLVVAAFAALVCVASALLDHEHILNNDLISEVNAKNGGLWTAGRNPRFEGMTVADIKKMLGSKLTHGKHGLPMLDLPIDVNALPSAFDWRTQTPNCVGAVRDQGHCGSCWAYGTAEALSDRFCVASKGANSVQLSTQIMVSCSDAGSCDGGYPSSAWDYAMSHGLPTDACYPTEMGSCHHPGCSDEPTPPCKKANTCADKSSYSLYHAASSYGVRANADAIATEIMTNGPVTAAFSVCFVCFLLWNFVLWSVSGAYSLDCSCWGIGL